MACQHKTYPGCSFCCHCGKKLATIQCHCGFSSVAHDQFCARCGHNFSIDTHDVSNQVNPIDTATATIKYQLNDILNDASLMTSNEGSVTQHISQDDIRHVLDALKKESL